MSSRRAVYQFTVFSNCSIIYSTINCRIINSFLHFILLFDNVFFLFCFLLCPEMQHKSSDGRCSFYRFPTDAETLGSYHKVNSYYNYSM